MTPRLVIFDMDGTLVDSSGLLVATINHVRSRLGLAPMSREQILPQINNPQINPARYFYDTDHFEPIHEEWFLGYYAAHHDTHLRLYDGIEDLLVALRETGCMLALATNAYRAATLASLSALGIESSFDAILCQDDVTEPKPAPDMLHAILAQLDVDVSEAVFVGDGPRDEEAARYAGMDYIMVDWGFTEYGDERVIRSVEGLRERLGVSAGGCGHAERL